jgi:hypothetical protein
MYLFQVVLELDNPQMPVLKLEKHRREWTFNFFTNAGSKKKRKRGRKKKKRVLLINASHGFTAFVIMHHQRLFTSL